jgi:hypothetical protein
MLDPMLADQVGQAAARASGKVVLRLLVLQVVHSQQNHREPFLGRFKALQSEIAQAQRLFQVEVVDLHRPALLIVSQGFLSRQG